MIFFKSTMEWKNDTSFINRFFFEKINKITMKHEKIYEITK